MADNSAYGFGLDFYDGNSVRDWQALAEWAKGVQFAYFRLGIGLYVDKRDLIMGCEMATKWDIGQFYEVWLPDVPKADQLAVIQHHIDPAAKLPLALAFEEQGYEDKHGNKIVAWPSVGDLHFLMDSVPGSICYTSLAGLDQIKTVIGSIPNGWKFWIARYLSDATQEMGVDDTVNYLKAHYGIERERILFMQTAPAGAYPQGASYDKGADYDRRLTSSATTVPPETPVQMVVNAPAGLNIRSAPSMTSAIVGGLKNSDTVYGVLKDGWLALGGYVEGSYLNFPNTPPPQPPLPVGPFYRVLHDEEMPPEFLPRMLQRGSVLGSDKGVPEVVDLRNSLNVELNSGLQSFIYASLKTSDGASGLSESDFQRAYKSLLGAHEAFANGTGFATNDGDAPRWNTITGENSDSALPKLDMVRTCGGNPVRVLSEVPVNVTGVPCLKVETIKASVIPLVADVNYHKTPWLVFRCTTVTPFPVTVSGQTRYRCNPFPQLGGHDVPMPFISRDGFGFIPVARLVKITTPFDIDPYVP